MASGGILLIQSVPHTGTHFMGNLLREHGFEVTYNHFGAPCDVTYPIICPIRQPDKVWVTWQSHGRQADFYKSWELFNKAYESIEDLFIVPVDTFDRDWHLTKLSMRLGTPMKTDWTPVASKPRIETDPIDLRSVYSLPVVQAFY